MAKKYLKEAAAHARAKKQASRSASKSAGSGNCDTQANLGYASMKPLDLDSDSLVQEVIEKAGHLCIFLLKFHCELNFIEYFWVQVKKYLRDNCDYTFKTLKENMLKALASVQISTIRQWEHQMHQWMEAYRSGLETKDAQLEVRKFGSSKSKSSRRVPEHIARAFNS
jgi:hypothetical protein